MATETTPQKKPISINYIVSGIFAALSIISLIRQEYFEFAAWVTMVLALLLADMHYVPKGADAKDVRPIPKWRRYLSILLLAIGVASMGYIIGRDVKAKVERETVTTQALNKQP